VDQALSYTSQVCAS